MTGERGATEKKRRGKRFDRAIKQTTLLGVTGAEPLTEPEFWSMQKPDMIFPRACRIPALAPIDRFIDDRALAFEHFSSSLRKGARKRIRRLYLNLEDYAELLYLWLHGLDPNEHAWDQLRWGFPPHPMSTVDRMRYFRNPDVPVEQKHRLWSLLMSSQYALEIDPNENPYDVVLEKGMRQGLEQGLEQGFEALLFVARKVLTAEELRHFQDQPVSAKLVDELREAISEALPTDY